MAQPWYAAEHYSRDLDPRWESLKEQKDTAAGVKMLGCGHTFCSGCIGEHIRTQAAARVAVTCPMCRYNIPASERA